MKASAREKALAAAFSGLKETPDVDTFIARCNLPATGDVPKLALLFPRFREDSPDIPAFTEWLWLNAINYVIPLRKRKRAQEATAKSATGGDMSMSTRLVIQAKRAFIEYKKAHPNRASEVGELLAYLIALHYLGAAQIASKMALKTNTNMPIHGLDGVHATFESGIMTLYFLEAKLSKTAVAGISQYAKSVAGFGTSRKQYLLEYEIVSDLGNIGALNDEARAIALEYLDVYGAKKSKRIERSIGVICYTELEHYKKKLPKDKNRAPSAHEQAFERVYGSDYDHRSKASKKHLVANKVDPAECEIYFIAVPSVDDLRKKFSETSK